MFNNFFHKIHYDMPFEKKMNRIYLTIFILPLIVINLIIIMIMTNRMSEQISYSTDKNFHQTLDYLEAYISSIDTLAFNLSRINDFQDFYQNSEAFKKLSASNIYLIRSNLNKKIYTVISTSRYSNFSFYFGNKLDFLANNDTYYQFENISDQIWFNEMIENFNKNRRSFLICPPHWVPENEKKVISFARTIFNMNNYWDLFGIVKVDMPLENLIDILKKNITVKQTSTYILNYKQEIIASYQEGNEKELRHQLPYLRYIPDYNGDTVKLSGKNYMVWQAPIGGYNLNLITLIPVGAIVIQSQLLFIVIILTLFFLSFTVSVIFKKEFSILTTRLQLVINNMLATNNGILSEISEESGKDEAGQLIINYNIMVDNLRNMIEEGNRYNIELKNYELQVIWEQINPHFLYNNLEMINWLAKNGQNEKISIAVDSLALFYQVALSGGLQKIPLSIELEHIHTYINLQNMRFENVLNYQCKILDDYSSLLVPRNILQPIVENAIIHGILEKESGTGTVKISININQNILSILIEDDGIGMGQEKVKKLNSSRAMSLTGIEYGVAHVAKRIELMYGSSYGLLFKSDLGLGTSVIITLPLDKE